ncbi:MAG TPA: ABC-type transport auxiliary lipoprotein family protein [Burkholderiaceae bacterium]|nr:ABC-type transport auxiliary lipoprotein family protein [Burkholderiaceae bacterium]
MTARLVFHDPRGRVTALAVATLLAACGSPPPDSFHTLRGPAGTRSEETRPTASVLGIGPVTVPQALERPGWLVREGPTAMRVYEHQLWTQDLDVEIAQALADDLDAGPGAAARPWADPAPPGALLSPSIAPAGALRVRVQVLRFDSRLAPEAGVSDAVRWTLECGATDGSGWQVLGGAVRTADVPATLGPATDAEAGVRFDGLAAAHAQAIARVAADIAEALDQTAAVRNERCVLPVSHP